MRAKNCSVGWVDEIAASAGPPRNDGVWAGMSRERGCRWVNEIAASAEPPRNDDGGVDPFYPSNPRPSGLWSLVPTVPVGMHKVLYV